MATYKEIRDIVVGKLVDKTLDKDYEELSEALFGEGNCFCASEVRKRMYGMQTVIEAIEKERLSERADDEGISYINERMAELQKEKQKFFDQRNAYNKLLRDEARKEEIDEIISDAVSSGNLPRLDYQQTPVIRGDNDMIVSLNDIHYGASHSNYWGEYNPDICYDMFCRYLDRIFEIQATHGSENCYITANGDMISGNIHYSIAVTNKENVISQVMGVSELIAQFISELSAKFRNVYYVSVAGNHSRLSPDKDKDSTAERLDDLVEWYLKARLSEFANVHIGAGEKIDNTMYAIDVRGKTYVGVHGDYDESASKIQALQTMVGRKVYAVLLGHLHHNRVDTVQGVKTVMSGSFQGMDDYCVKKRIYGYPEQIVCVCDESGIVCYYDVELDERNPGAYSF